MARTRAASPPPPPAAPDRSGVTPDRFARLARMIRLLAGRPLTRDDLTRRLRLDIRGFYRDLGLVRSAGVAVDLAGGRYHLADDAQEALGLLPFPDPHLTLAEARILAQGRTPVHRKLRELVERVRP